MHQAVMDFVAAVKGKFPEAFEDRTVLEVGSRYINGTVRTLFEGCDYTGLDLAYGPLVDEVCHVKDYEAPQAPFDTLISCEALEHDRDWAASLARMVALLNDGGLLVITCAGPGRPEHGTHRTDPESSPATCDYYQNITEAMFWSAVKREAFKEHFIRVADGDLQFWGIKL